jgi:Flp pilus assembly secretin CpaC
MIRLAVASFQTFLRFAAHCRETLTRAPCSLEADAMTRPVSPIRLIAVLGSAAILLAPAVGTAQSASLNVEIDQARRVQLRGPAGSVIIGNPEIADVTVVDANTLYITGKGYGVTEIVAVDPIGRTVFQSQIVVTAGDGAGRVRVWRGGEATEMACASSCAPSLRGTSGNAPTP